MTEDHLRLAGKAHVLDILRALTTKPGGLSYTQIHYSIVQTSATSGLLKNLEVAGIVSKSREGYRLTQDGRTFLGVVETLTGMHLARGIPIHSDERRRRRPIEAKAREPENGA